MADDYMSDTDTAAAPEVDTPTEETSDTKTSLLPIAFFQGKELEPGTECKVRIESVEDDQVQVSYVPHTEEESEEAVAEMPESPPETDMMA